MGNALPDSTIAAPGAMRDQIQIDADFDAPLDEQFEAVLYGSVIPDVPA